MHVITPNMTLEQTMTDITAEEFMEAVYTFLPHEPLREKWVWVQNRP